jgi:glucose/arabinose dehydrogenase
MILNRSSGWIARALAALSLTAACAAAFGGCSSELPSTDSDEREPVAGLMQAATIVDPGFTDTTVVTGISNPTAMAFAPDGRLFVAQQTGALRVVKNGALLATPFLTVPVDSAGERGLLGVTFDPNFGSNRLVYVYYTTTSGGTHNRISRFTANGDVATAGSEQILVDLPGLSSATNHNGGALHFGNDGKLYVAVGDNATGSNAQSMSIPFGKMLRFNADGTIPSDNPFFGSTSGLNRAIWALGLRNPFTFDVRRTSGAILINDVGNGGWEEVNSGGAGRNFGWPATEGATSNPAYTTPVFAYPHAGGTSGGCAITGGAFYDPASQQFPASYVGKYFFADYCNGWMRKLDPANGTATVFATGLNGVVDIRVGPEGALYYLARGNGSVGRISYPTSQAPSIASQPSSVTVPVGASATFGVSANGSSPLAYQWQRNGANISGATSPNYTLSNAQASDSGAQFRAVVSNSFGSATSNAATLTVTTNRAPSVSITSPAVGATYTGGSNLTFAGTGTDPEDGTLPASAFTWRIDLHHDQHNHPAMQDTSGIRNGTWPVPNTGHTETTVWYRVHLTVRDSAGLTATSFVDVQPVIRQLTLNTQPPGLQVTLDGQPFTSPLVADSVVGVMRDIGVVSPQSSGGKLYGFSSWSDGGGAVHPVTTPGQNTTYTATFTETTGFTGQYYDNLDLTALVTTRSDATIDFDWGAGVPAPGVGADSFSVRWTGNVVPSASQTYTFYTVSDDGIRLWVNGNLVIDNWTNHGPTENTANVALVAGQSYPIRLEYYDNGGGAVAKLHWSSPSMTRRPVTAGGGSTPPPGLSITSSTSAGAFQTPPSSSHDGNEGTRYTNDGTLATASITYTLSGSASLTGLRLLMYSGTNRTYPVRISVGSTVVFTGATTAGASYWQATFPATTGTSLTVTMTGPNSAGSNWFSIFEAQPVGTLQ